MINKSIINRYNKQGVIVLRNIISKKWISILKQGLKKILINQVSTNVFMKKIKKNFSMMIIVIGNE